MSTIQQRTVEEVTAIAEHNGLIPFLAGDNELLIDYDVKAPNNDHVIITLEENGISIISSLQTTSKSGNQHLYYRLNRTVTVPERIALQSLLGSDPIRETLSLVRWFTGSEHEAITALFETEKEAKKVKKWRSK
jgi:hypothetical protein